uniref:DUF306 domain-containing protein n=1 Tax=uncultured Thiotrichaceae bacterium TaxID=298394 RepID=A0A6S6S1Q9_9GAMM|nr:MAG: Unknown protein [uncultured Thiotrichaceae bacterium]
MMLITKQTGFWSLFLGVVLSGCGSTMSVPDNGGGGAMQPKQLFSAALTTMNWRLASVYRGGGAVTMLASNVTTMLASDVPVNRYTLSFTKGGGVSLSGGCNQAGSRFTVSAPDNITFGRWMSTKRACIGSLMKADAELLQLLMPVTNYQLNGQQLRLSGPVNTLVFNGVVTDANRYDGEGVRKFIDVKSTKAGLLWREAKYDSNWVRINKDAPWTRGNFPGIQQFTPKVGMEYTVRINEFREASTGKVVWVKDRVTMTGMLK